MKGLHILLGSVLLASLFSTGSSRCQNQCGYGAECQQDDCVCLANNVGNADFFCYNPAVFLSCSLSSDPVIAGFDGVKTGIKMPASLSVTSITVPKQGGGQLTFTLDAWSKRFKGKYFIEGLQFKVEHPHDTDFRVITKVNNMGGYEWTIYKRVALVWNLQITLTPGDAEYSLLAKGYPGCEVKFVPHLDSMFLVVVIQCANIVFGIRPFDHTNTTTAIPGIWIRVPSTNPAIIGLPQCVCNNPGGPNVNSLVNSYGFTDRTQLMTYLGLVNGRPLVYPEAYPQLGNLQTLLKDNCADERRSDMMTKAYFLFDYAKLINCTGDETMSLTHQVAQGYCDNNAVACDAAINEIETTCPNIKKNDNLKDFLNNGCV